MLRRTNRARVIWLLRMAVVMAAVAAYVWALPSAFGLNGSSSKDGYPYGNSYPYGNAYGQDRVPMCHKGHTILVSPPAVAEHLADGDTLGACP